MLKKKLNSKGFTLAELLVVIAILAILIAIAIPVFSHMVAEANLRVNQANVRSTRSAGVAHVLTHLEGEDENGTKMNAGLGVDAGWVATALVDNNGDVTDLKVYVVSDVDSYKNGICEDHALTGPSKGTAADGFYELSDDVTNPFATVKPNTEIDGVKQYCVQAVIHDLDTD